MDEYRLEIKVKNNLIYKRIMNLGYISIKKFCLHNYINYSHLLNLINLKEIPLNNKDGKYRAFVYKLCDALKCIPEELFTSKQLECNFETNKFIKTVKEAEVKFVLNNTPDQLLLEEFVDNSRLLNKINEALNTLTPREANVIRLRFGLDENQIKTLSEISEIFDVSRERIRKIEAKALRKLRHSSRSEHLRDYFYE